MAALSVVAVGCGSTAPATAPPSSSPPPPVSSAAPPPTGTHPATTRPNGRSGGPVNGGWFTYYRDAGRDGDDPTSPPVGRATPAWTSPPLDGQIYVQPLVVGSAVIVATENDSVYALDALTGAVRWKRHLGTPIPGGTLPCGNIDPSGITGTPVAEPSAGALWVVGLSQPLRHTLWSLNLSTGAVTSARAADPRGADPRALQQRGALALHGRTVYIPYGGLFGDCSDYHGWIVGLSTSQPANSVPLTWETDDARAGIWAPPGPVVAPDGSILAATGNGTPAGVVGGSQSVVRLSPTLTLNSSFTPADYAQLSASDLDLGSTSPALVGGLIFQVGKDGVGYLLSATNLGGVGGQLASARICGGGFGGAAVDGSTVIVSCFDSLTAVQVSPAQRGRPPTLTVKWMVKGSHPGPPIVAGGAVWSIASHGRLLAVSLTTGTIQYQHSIVVAGSFPSPAAADGLLFAPAGRRVDAFKGV